METCCIFFETKKSTNQLTLYQQGTLSAISFIDALHIIISSDPQYQPTTFKKLSQETGSYITALCSLKLHVQQLHEWTTIWYIFYSSQFLSTSILNWTLPQFNGAGQSTKNVTEIGDGKIASLEVAAKAWKVVHQAAEAWTASGAQHLSAFAAEASAV